MQAPTGSNSQGWAWVVVEDPDKKRAIADYYGGNFDLYAQSAGAQYAEGDLRNEQRDGVRSSAMYLRENFHRVPFMVIPVIRGRVDNMPGAVQAGFWGSILPAAWSLMLAAARARPRLRVDDAPPAEREGSRRAPRHRIRQVVAGRPLPDRLHEGHRLQARQAPPPRPVRALGHLVVLTPVTRSDPERSRRVRRGRAPELRRARTKPPHSSFRRETQRASHL